MFILKLLGGASVDGPDGPFTGRVSQRRRLAALALLAMNRRQGLGREKLAAILWPESDGDRARHLLSDTVYVINRALGGDIVTGVGDELRLNLERLGCDARAFEDAVERGALDDAVRLYAGPLLDGFAVEGSEEFERWMLSERERLQDLYGRAVERLALERRERGDIRGAVECWRRLAADDPFNSRVACALAHALDHAGDRAGALHHLQAHVSTLAKELGIPPPEDVATLVRTLRAPRISTEPARAATVAAAAQLPAHAETVREPSAATQIQEAVHDGAAAAEPTPSRLRPFASVAAVAALLVAGAIFFFRPFDPTDAPALTASGLQSVAVLPFADLSPDRDHEYFSDGIAEEVSTRLARVAGLKVAARTSAFAFKGTGTDVKTIGRALNVDAVVEGSVREADGNVRVTARLVDARAGYQIWSETWNRGGRDVLALQDEIAAGVARALRPGGLAVAPASPARKVDLQAYDLYLQGRYLWHQRTADSLKRAAALFDRAVALAPSFAEAHSGVADAYAVLGFYDHLPPHDAFPRARAAAVRALEIDDQLAPAHASLGYVALYYDWEWQAAERELNRSIELNAGYSIGHQWLANYLVARGRFDQAVTAMRRAQEADPLSLIASAALGWIHYHRRDFDAAVQQCRRTIELNANFEQAWLWGGQAHEAAGRYNEALTMLQRAAELSNGSAAVLAALGHAHAVSGDLPAARRIAGELQRAHAGYVPAYEMAKLHLSLGERTEALRVLERAYDQRSHSLVFLAVDPQLDALRSDPRFRELAEKIGATLSK